LGGGGFGCLFQKFKKRTSVIGEYWIQQGAKLSGGQVTLFRYFKRNYFLSIYYPFFLETVPLQLLVSALLKVTKSLLVTTKK
jgi:hypothetical protein